jgi:hypothetical protein
MSRAASKEEGQRLEQQKRQPTGLALTRRRLLGVMVGMGLVASSGPRARARGRQRSHTASRSTRRFQIGRGICKNHRPACAKCARALVVGLSER